VALLDTAKVAVQMVRPVCPTI